MGDALLSKCWTYTTNTTNTTNTSTTNANAANATKSTIAPWPVGKMLIFKHRLLQPAYRGQAILPKPPRALPRVWWRRLLRVPAVRVRRLSVRADFSHWIQGAFAPNV